MKKNLIWPETIQLVSRKPKGERRHLSAMLVNCKNSPVIGGKLERKQKKRAFTLLLIFEDSSRVDSDTREKQQ